MVNFIVFYPDKNDTFYTEGDFSALLLKLTSPHGFCFFVQITMQRKDLSL